MDDDMLAQLIADFGQVCSWRRSFAPSANPAGWIGPGPDVTTRPTALRDAGWDTVEQAITDSTLDDGTGYQGGFAPAVNVGVLFTPSAAPAAADRTPFGEELAEPELEGVVLAAQMTPAKGDLIVHPNGQRYDVGSRIARIGTSDAPVGYRFALRRRQPGDVLASA